MTALPDATSPTVDAILAAYATRETDEERTYLGMSTLGADCDRALWYGFRWAVPPERHDGRMLRLFATGHREEARMIEDLRANGVNVLDRDPATGEQWALSALGGHFRGHMDGKATGIIEAPGVEHLLEIKTHNDKSFKSLKDGVAKANPGHYAQMQLYMHFGGLTRAYYLAYNKNDDQLYGERIHYDPLVAAVLIARAERIIKAQRPPARLHDDPDAKMAWQCRYCPALAACHERAMPERAHCRTCLHATPVDGGWHCARHDRLLTIVEQRQGCPAHLYIPDLVPGEQVNVDEAAETVTYMLHDGTTWVDGLEGTAA